MIKYIIMAGGPATRWNNYLGVPKHLIEIDGEKLINRTTRLLRDNGQNSIIILGPKEFDHRYSVIGANHILTNGLYDCFHEMFTPLTDSDDTYVLLGGDVWYTVECIAKIVEGHAWVGRWGPSSVTGQMHEELWAVTMTPESKPILKIELETAKKRLTRATAWDVARSLRKQSKLEDWCEIDDWTCDFDTPEDYKTWNQRRKNGTATA